MSRGRTVASTSSGVLFACFLPSLDKSYVVEEILATLKQALGDPVLYVGIQHGSHPSTERIIRSIAKGSELHIDRVREDLYIDSDAASFVAALGLLRRSGARHSRCYFIHTKGITSNDDNQRRDLLNDLMDERAVARALAPRGVGSYGPHLTISRSEEDVASMEGWIRRFVPGMSAPAFPYFYAHTLWVAKGECVESFLRIVDATFFVTPLTTFSDRYFAERDLPHFVDMLSGKRPSYGRLAGSYTTDYRRTRTREYVAKLSRWHLRAAPYRLRQAALLVRRSPQRSLAD